MSPLYCAVLCCAVDLQCSKEGGLIVYLSKRLSIVLHVMYILYFNSIKMCHENPTGAQARVAL